MLERRHSRARSADAATLLGAAHDNAANTGSGQLDPRIAFTSNRNGNYDVFVIDAAALQLDKSPGSSNETRPTWIPQLSAL